MHTLFLRLRLPVASLAAAIALFYFSPAIADRLGLPEGSGGAETLRQVCETLMLIAAAWLVIRLLHVFVWTGVLLKHSGSPASRLLVDLVNGLIAVTVFVLVSGRLPFRAAMPYSRTYRAFLTSTQPSPIAVH